jgi:2-polyprenyl-6-methoxyphenol hydroxylase-like FAD-dependent oxidoreductase
MYDVIVVGYGPTGMLASILLGRAGLRVAVLERYKTLYNFARAGIVHDDVLRMFQEVGCIDEIWPSTQFLPVFDLVRNGKVLLSSPVSPIATHGWPEYVSIYQPAFEKELDRLARAERSVEIFKGKTVTAVAQDAETVTATAVDENGGSRTIAGRYLIGADGGNSFVRQALGVAYENLGFDQDWLVVDARVKRERPGLPSMRQYCEPEQPSVALRIGPYHRRWTFMIFPDESREEAVKPENVWRRLDRQDGATPDEVELVRVVCYRFQSLYAGRWRVGRAFLIGDAAHQMPPLLAQGMCSGLRDAQNLVGKLKLVFKGLAPDSFLDTYEAERGPNVRATIAESMRVAQLVIERDPEKVKKRDADLEAMQAQKTAVGQKKLIAFRVPGLTAGFIARHAPAAGDAFPQARVRGDAEGRFDDVAGRGFLILARGGDPVQALSEQDLAFWRALGGKFVRLRKDGADPAPGEILDAEGSYTQLMDEYGCDVIVKRDDYHIFGAGRSVADLPGLLSDLREQLSPQDRRAIRGERG